MRSNTRTPAKGNGAAEFADGVLTVCLLRANTETSLERLAVASRSEHLIICVDRSMIIEMKWGSCKVHVVREGRREGKGGGRLLVPSDPNCTTAASCLPTNILSLPHSLTDQCPDR